MSSEGSTGEERPNAAPGDTGEQPPNAAPGGSTVSRIVAHMSANKVEAGLWCTRLFTLGCCFNFVLPLFGGNPMNAYQKALMANAATSALRLHQRLPNFQLSREFLSRMLLEDSAHYLFYSVLFMYNAPITMVLVPVLLFALLHVQSYTLQLLDIIGPDSVQILRRMISNIKSHQQFLLRFIAINEIILMPTLIFMLFQGGASLLQPFVYYRFLALRYASLRNPYSRQSFYELRVTAETLIWKPQCPLFVRNSIIKVIGFICRLAPQTAPAPQAQ